MIRRLFYNLRASRHREHALRRLRWLERKLPTPLLRFGVPPAFRGRGHFKSMRIMQHGEEIFQLYEMILRQRPRRILEIGTACGGTLYLWTQAAADDATIISIDLPGGPFGGGYPPACADFYRAFAREGQRLHLLRRDARDGATRQQVEQLLAGQELDFLFIDADHTYEGISTNFRLYAPLVRPGGLIALHDVLPNPRNADIQVWRFWQELRADASDAASEIIGSEAGGRPYGIGLLRAPAAASGAPQHGEVTAHA